jgi:uncharacterized protein (DUF58 family)
MAVHRIELDELVTLRRVAETIQLGYPRLVTTEQVGPRVSGFRGRGMDFEEHRAYQPGDEARTIDWRVTARTGKPHVRVYREERERPVILAADLRSPMWFGTRGCFKAVHAARAAALCAWSACSRGDRIGGIVFGDDGHTEIRAASGIRGVMRLLHTLESGPAKGTTAVKGGMGDAIQRLLRTVRPGSVVGLFTDFRDVDRPAHDLLVRLGLRTELMIGFVHDILESELPPSGLYPVADRTGSPPIMVDTAGASRKQWRAAFEARRQAAQDLVRRTDSHWLDLNTATPVLDAFARVFGRRRKAA